jgi:hypothetical protein
MNPESPLWNNIYCTFLMKPGVLKMKVQADPTLAPPSALKPIKKVELPSKPSGDTVYLKV